MSPPNRAVTLALALLAVPPAAAQTRRFRSTVAAVRVDVLVTDGRRPVGGLTAGNFELRDNGILQRITDVHFETLPLNVICVLDTSGSVSGRPLAQLKEGVSAVIDALAAGDRAALVTFSNRLQLHTPLTADRNRLRSAADAVVARGSTSLFDGVFAGLALREADEGRSLLLLFSDGMDTASWLSAARTLEAARRSDVVVYAIAAENSPRPTRPSLSTGLAGGHMVRATPERPLSQRFLAELSDDTGGRLISVDAETTLRETFLSVLNEFRQRYVLGYEPSGVSSAGWHSIDVKLKGRSGQVRARRGYSAN